ILSFYRGLGAEVRLPGRHLMALQPELSVNYCKLAVTSTDPAAVTMRRSLAVAMTIQPGIGRTRSNCGGQQLAASGRGRTDLHATTGTCSRDRGGWGLVETEK